MVAKMLMRQRDRRERDQATARPLMIAFDEELPPSRGLNANARCKRCNVSAAGCRDHREDRSAISIFACDILVAATFSKVVSRFAGIRPGCGIDARRAYGKERYRFPSSTISESRSRRNREIEFRIDPDQPPDSVEFVASVERDARQAISFIGGVAAQPIKLHRTETLRNQIERCKHVKPRRFASSRTSTNSRHRSVIARSPATIRVAGISAPRRWSARGLPPARSAATSRADRERGYCRKAGA